ncbi:MAG: leucine-rich repeat protein, partial [Candidatus Cryptobacteroides sp.]
SFSYTANESGKYRAAIVNLKNDLGQTIEAFSIVQRAPETTGNVVFADATVKNACVSRYDKDGDGELSYDEAAVVTDVKDLFKDVVGKVTSFDEFQHFISVTEIPENFLLNARLLESIVLPESLKTIGRSAFENCVALKEIVIPEGVAYDSNEYYYNKSWFEGCENLTKAVLPSTLTVLPTNGFYNCASLRSVNIPEEVKIIPNGCFYGCSSLQSIELPSTLISISASGFSDCSSLKSITLPEGFTFVNVDQGDPYYSEHAFANCTSLETVSLPKSLKSLPRYCFSGCSSLKTIAVPDGVTSIGYYCFSGCTSLESVTLPSRLDSGLETSTFRSCASLESITIPEGVTAIPSHCFAGCLSLSEVILPQSVYEIQDYAFENCKSLKSFDFSNINYLGEYGKFGCRAHFAGSGLKSVTFPASVNKIPEEMFENCDSLATVKLHENITHIGGSAFRGTAISGDIVEGTQVKALEIPAQVEYIGSSAFRDCPNLKNIVFYPSTPPQVEWSFEDSMTLYVPDASLEVYRQNYPYYSVLPFSMFGVELKPECSIQFVDLTDEGKLRFHINVNLKSDFDYEYGIYVYPKGGSVEYIPVVEGTTDYVYECNKWDMELEDLSDESRKLRYYRSSLNIGAYMRVEDKVIRYGSEEMPFIHRSFYPCYIATQVDEDYYMASSPLLVDGEPAIFHTKGYGQYSYIWVASAGQYFIRSSDGIYIGANADNEKFVFADDYSSISENYLWKLQDDDSIKNYGTGKIIGIDTNTGYFGTYSPDSLPDGVLASNLY